MDEAQITQFVESIDEDLLSDAATFLQSSVSSSSSSSPSSSPSAPAPLPLPTTASASSTLNVKTATLTASLVLNQVVNLEILAQSFPGGNIVFDPHSRAFETARGKSKRSFRNQASIQLRYRGHRISICVFCNGKMRLIGCKSDEECHEVAKIVIDKISKSAFRTASAVANPATLSYSKLTVTMRKADACLGFPIPLDVAVETLRHDFEVRYEPRTYNGVRVCVPLNSTNEKKKKQSTTTVILYESGKLACMGNMTEDEMHWAFSMVGDLMTARFGQQQQQVFNNDVEMEDVLYEQEQEQDEQQLHVLQQQQQPVAVLQQQQEQQLVPALNAQEQDEQEEQLQFQEQVDDGIIDVAIQDNNNGIRINHNEEQEQEQEQEQQDLYHNAYINDWSAMVGGRVDDEDIPQTPTEAENWAAAQFILNIFALASLLVLACTQSIQHLSTEQDKPQAEEQDQQQQRQQSSSKCSLQKQQQRSQLQKFQYQSQDFVNLSLLQQQQTHIMVAAAA